MKVTLLYLTWPFDMFNKAARQQFIAAAFARRKPDPQYKNRYKARTMGNYAVKSACTFFNNSLQPFNALHNNDHFLNFRFCVSSLESTNTVRASHLTCGRKRLRCINRFVCHMNFIL